MFNLLPSSLKDSIKGEYMLRRLIVILIFLLFITSLFLVFLFPSWLISVYREKEVITQVDDVNKSPLASSVNSIIATILGTNTRLKVLNILDYTKASPFIDSILSNKSSSIHINNITYTFVDKSSAKISIGGVARTRESLVSFVKHLQDSKIFKIVDSPVSNLAKDKDIYFSIDLTIAK